jgi:hypothetical protein
MSEFWISDLNRHAGNSNRCMILFHVLVGRISTYGIVITGICTRLSVVAWRKRKWCVDKEVFYG